MKYRNIFAWVVLGVAALLVLFLILDTAWAAEKFDRECDGTEIQGRCANKYEQGLPTSTHTEEPTEAPREQVELMPFEGK